MATGTGYLGPRRARPGTPSYSTATIAMRGFTRALWRRATRWYGYNAFNQLKASGTPVTCAAGDSDCDGIPDAQDNCPFIYNPGQEDTDAGKANPLGANAIAVWGFDEASGTTAKDAVDAHDGTLVNGATRGPGRFGQGLKLDGVDDRVFVSSVNRPSGAFSIVSGMAKATVQPDRADF